MASTIKAMYMVTRMLTNVTGSSHATFWCDPVMPGSLGIESMYQLIESFCIHTGIGNGMKQRRFEHDLGKVSWKYRGQLTPKNDTMDSEIHIKSIVSVGDNIVILADGALYVDNLRVYTASKPSFGGARCNSCRKKRCRG